MAGGEPVERAWIIRSKSNGIHAVRILRLHHGFREGEAPAEPRGAMGMATVEEHCAMFGGSGGFLRFLFVRSSFIIKPKTLLGSAGTSPSLRAD
jgi:hypothetical protein